ncbi:sigma 54-interacting transcriptional regulator [Desulfovibrio sp. OttesenSCG-928-O18]|nr:sigma 54-interacting transcriptional regulator [Desulfovibrio sp. OttesenSCG-928-O18]
MEKVLQEGVTYVGDLPAEFCVVTPLPALARYAEEAARQLNVRTCIVLSGLDNDIELALEMLREEKVKIVAARGHPVQVLRSKTSAPILAIDYSSEDFFATLLPYQNSGMRIGLLCFPGQGMNFVEIAKLLGLDGRRLEVEDRNNLGPVLQAAKDEDISLLVGGLGVTSKARELGVKAIPLLSEGRESINQVFTEAKHLLTMDAINTQRQLFMNTVLNINPNIIVVVDDQLVVKYANGSAIKTFEPVCSEFIGLPLSAIFPYADFGAVCRETAEKNEPSVLTDALHREFLFQMVKISLPHGFEGHVVSLSNVVEIQKNERKVRQNVYDKNLRPLFSFDDIIGESRCIKRVRQMGVRFAGSDDPVLLVGDTGTGKEMFAQAIHTQSWRRAAPFVTVNCASLPENLLESELFGYEEGAFTGARRGGKTGLFELAHGGTLFLDEIGEMSLPLQSRLLRVLQDKMVMRVGSTRPIPVDVRIVCATNRSILRMIEEGTFRSDLFYRINTLILKIPDLKERKDDIEIIVKDYLEKHASSRSGSIRITPEALEKLKENVWRGNVRELLHIVDRAIVVSDGNIISQESVILDDDILAAEKDEQGPVPKGPHPDSGSDEYNAIREALQANRYNKGKTACALGVSRATLWRKMRQYSLP